MELNIHEKFNAELKEMMARKAPKDEIQKLIDDYRAQKDATVKPTASETLKPAEKAKVGTVNKNLSTDEFLKGPSSSETLKPIIKLDFFGNRAYEFPAKSK
jgi:hypothetical protein